MGNLFIFKRTALSFAVAATITGCSDVKFSPSDPNQKFDLPDSETQKISENFVQGTYLNPIDILFVVDNSPSMAEEQKEMGRKIGSFLGSLRDVDWQIGITTTDISGGKFSSNGQLLRMDNSGTYILKPTTPNYETLFNNTIVRKESFNCGYDCASGDEQPLAATIMTMANRDTSNRGFFRPGADLGVLILSDEDEFSTGGANATPAIRVIQQFERIWGNSKNLYAYGMIIEPGDAECLRNNPNGGAFGTFVSTFTQLTGGSTGSVCADDYGPTLSRLAQDVRHLLNYVELSQDPASREIAVRFSPSFISKVSLQGKRVYMDPPPPNGTHISVDYRIPKAASGVTASGR